MVVMSRGTTALAYAVTMMLSAAVVAADAGNPRFPRQEGVVRSGDSPIAYVRVTAMQAGRRPGSARVLGVTYADRQGHFEVRYRRPAKGSVVYLLADGARTYRPGPVRLATVLGQKDVPDQVVIDERTTVATAYSMAQFIEGGRIGGNRPGVPNAAWTFRNLVDLDTARVAEVLASSPNGTETATLPTFNSIANMLSACVRSSDACAPLFEATTPPDGATPRNTLEAAAAIAKHPGNNVAELVQLAQAQQTFEPALEADAATDPEATVYVNALILALIYEGRVDGQGVMDGPGNIAFDKNGNAWVNNNYAFAEPALRVTCGSTLVSKLAPNGEQLPESPFGGDDATQDGVGAGGLYGAGYGIAVDPYDTAWITNFGFQGQKLDDDSPNPTCENNARDLAVSVSRFATDGTALSPDGNPSENQAGGYQPSYLMPGTPPDTVMGQPQGVASDRLGHIWIAGCIGGTITRFIHGNPNWGQLMKVEDSSPIVDAFDQAFDVAIDHRGHAWVTGNASSNVVEVDHLFRVVTNLTEGFDRPMGIAVDSLGNMWVANAGLPSPPCPPALSTDPSRDIGEDGSENTRAAVSLIRNRGPQSSVEKFGKEDGSRDGLRWPWGIAVDGADNVFISNFAGQRIMQLCGARGARCPQGVETGDPLSPDSGYYFGGLQRVTAVEVDPSGNLWATNNWKLDGFSRPQNPGGNGVVVFIGLAGPVKTPLLGPVRQP